jgi:hypothetical protein
MTVIRLDAATLAQLQVAKNPVILADENGKPVFEATLTESLRNNEPQLSAEELERILRESPKYKLSEVWTKIHKGEKM